jgi:SnoaL-like domain
MDDLQRQSIEQACQRLATRYCHLVDHGRAADVAELFSEDGVWSTAQGETAGRDAVRAVFQGRQARAGRLSRHVCCNLLVEVQDETHASGVNYLTLYRHDGEGAPGPAPLTGPAIVGEYRDDYVRTEDGWRFAKRDLVIVFQVPRK